MSIQDGVNEDHDISKGVDTDIRLLIFINDNIMDLTDITGEKDLIHKVVELTEGIANYINQNIQARPPR